MTKAATSGSAYNATLKSDCPCPFRVSKSAPASRRSATIRLAWSCPLAKASARAVSPLSSMHETLAPWSSAARTPGCLPSAASASRRVLPLGPIRYSISAPASRTCSSLSVVMIVRNSLRAAFGLPSRHTAEAISPTSRHHSIGVLLFKGGGFFLKPVNSFCRFNPCSFTFSIAAWYN